MSIPQFLPHFVGHYWDGADWNYLPMTHREVERAVLTNIRVMDTFRHPTRSGVLVIACFDDWALTIPLEEAVIRSKNIVYNADDSPFEANRIEAFLRRFNPPMVFGVSEGVLQGLQTMGHSAAELFAGRTVWCRDPAAYRQLAGVPEIRLRRWQQIGPAAAMECVAGGGLHVDAEEWLLEEDNGEILVTNRLGRFPEITRVTTGLKGSIDTRCCPCGISNPKVVLAD